MPAVEELAVEVERLRPEPGDLVVVRTRATVGTHEVKQLCDALRDILPEDVRGVVLNGENVDVQVMRAVRL